MCRSAFLIFITIFVTVFAGATNFEPVGVGGGGWLHSGAYLPTDADVICVGADVSGAYLSTDGGDSWTPFNAGLLNADENPTHYVEDIEGVDNAYFTGFVAATYGGIYKATTSGPWVSMTPIQDYWYDYDTGWTEQPQGIPFSCVDWDGGDILVAGAGQVRWGSSYEDTYYPAPDNVAASSHPDTNSIWIYDFSDANPSWTPMANTGFGAVRDITVLDDLGTTLIAAATTKGVKYWNGVSWISLEQHSAIVDLQTWGTLPYGTVLDGWSIHLSDRGSLYLACSRDGTNYPSSPFPSGVYRIPDVTGTQFWFYVDDYQNDSYFGTNMLTMARDGSVHPENPNHNIAPGQFIYMTVADQAGTDGKDLLYLGCRNGVYGLFRGECPNTGYFGEGSWTNLVADNGYLESGALTNADDGWNEWSAAVMFHPAVAPSDPDLVTVQFDVRLHYSEDGGDTWNLSYTEEGSSGWSQLGYNELCVTDLDWWGSQLVESTGDCGLFMSVDGQLDEFLDITPNVDGNYTDTPDSWVWNPECREIAVVDDWNQSGDPALFASFGDYVQKRRASRVMMYHDFTSGPEWRWIGDDLANPTCYLFLDLAAASDTTLYAIYNRYSNPLGQSTSLVAAGVAKFEYSGTDWATTFCNGTGGLDTTKTFTDLYYHETTNRLFLAAGHSHGGIWYMDLDDAVPDWCKCVGPDDENVPEAQDDFGDVKCIAGAADGSTLYAGTRGRSQDGWGTILKCVNPSAAMPAWTAQLNQDVNHCYLDIDTPYHQNWDELATNRRLTYVNSIIVDPNDADSYYFGLCGDWGLLQSHKGLWACDDTTFTKLDDGEAFEGITVSALELDTSSRLVVGTRGLETWHQVQSIGSKAKTGGKADFDLRIHQQGRRPGECVIAYELATRSRVQVEFYDVRGRLVSRTAPRLQEAGRQTFVWDGRSGQGLRCASGVYLVRVTAGRQHGRSKVTLVR